jgi:hypothetical protein
MRDFLNRAAAVLPRICGYGILAAVLAVLFAGVVSDWMNGAVSGLGQAALAGAALLFYASIPAALFGLSFGVATGLVGLLVYELLINRGTSRTVAATVGSIIVPLLGAWPGAVLLILVGSAPVVAWLVALAASLVAFSVSCRSFLRQPVQNM